jgi:hypothetical protein
MKLHRSHVIILTLALASTIAAAAWNASTFSDGDILSASALNALLNGNFQSLDDAKLDVAGGALTGPLAITTDAAAGDPALWVLGNDLDEPVGYFQNAQNASAAALMVKNQGTGPALALWSFGEGALIEAYGQGGSLTVSSAGVVENHVGSGLPLAYGQVQGGAIVPQATTENVLGVTWNAAQQRYAIDLADVNFYFPHFTTVVTPTGSSPLFATVNSVGGDLLVMLYDAAGNKVQGNFSFVIFRPGT